MRKRKSQTTWGKAPSHLTNQGNNTTTLTKNTQTIEMTSSKTMEMVVTNIQKEISNLNTYILGLVTQRVVNGDCQTQVEKSVVDTIIIGLKPQTKGYNNTKIESQTKLGHQGMKLEQDLMYRVLIQKDCMTLSNFSGQILTTPQIMVWNTSFQNQALDANSQITYKLGNTQDDKTDKSDKMEKCVYMNTKQ